MNTYEKLAASRLLGEMEKQAFKVQSAKHIGRAFMDGLRKTPGAAGSEAGSKALDAGRWLRGLLGKKQTQMIGTGVGGGLFGVGGSKWLDNMYAKKQERYPGAMMGPHEWARSRGREPRGAGGQLRLPLDTMYDRRMQLYPDGPMGLHERIRRTNRERAPNSLPKHLQGITLGPGGRRQ